LFNAKKIVAAVAVFGAGLAAFSTSSVVQAEPVSNSYAIVGSDTLEDVVNAIVNGTAITGSTVRVTQNGATLGSFDATGTPYIITKVGGARFSRPNGSGEGFKALSASIGGDASTTVAVSTAKVTAYDHSDSATTDTKKNSDTITFRYTPNGIALAAGATVNITGFTNSIFNLTGSKVTAVGYTAAVASPAAAAYNWFTVTAAITGTAAKDDAETPTSAASATASADFLSIFNSSTYQVALSQATVTGTVSGYDSTGTAKTYSYSKDYVNSSTLPSSLRNVNITDQVDISRSSSTDPGSSLRDASASDAKIVRVPFARDAIALAFGTTAAYALCDNGHNATTAAWNTTTHVGTCQPYMTATELKNLFNSSTQVANVGTLVALIPQSGSGTRKDFVSKTGITDATMTANTAVLVGQEHDATSLPANGVMPMSASRWIAMKNGASFDKSGTAVLGVVADAASSAGRTAVAVDADTNKLVPDATYYADTTWGRDVFLFVERARIESGNAKYDANLAALLDPANNKLANTQTTGASKVGMVKKLYGFLAPSSTDLAYFAPVYTGRK